MTTPIKLQSYILSTTTETVRHSFLSVKVSLLQSYILSTTTETTQSQDTNLTARSFNRTSFQQQLKPRSTVRDFPCTCFNRTSFQQQLKQITKRQRLAHWLKLQSYILSTTTETCSRLIVRLRLFRLQSYILSTTTETRSEANHSDRS